MAHRKPMRNKSHIRTKFTTERWKTVWIPMEDSHVENSQVDDMFVVGVIKIPENTASRGIFPNATAMHSISLTPDLVHQKGSLFPEPGPSEDLNTYQRTLFYQSKHD